MDTREIYEQTYNTGYVYISVYISSAVPLKRRPSPAP